MITGKRVLLDSKDSKKIRHLFLFTFNSVEKGVRYNKEIVHTTSGRLALYSDLPVNPKTFSGA